MPACFTPLQIRSKKDGKNYYVPCGKCPCCVSKRVSQWSFRLMQEERYSTSSYFITLTYSTKHVPISKNGFMEVSKRDCQLFFKRLRKAHHAKGKSIKYYLASEYGNQTRRPHYHIILFNADIGKIADAWDLGNVYFGSVTGASVGYTLKYISKNKSAVLHGRDDRQREFALQSKGLGKQYLTRQMIAWHRADLTERMYCNYEGMKRVSMPRYFKQFLYTENELKWINQLVRLNMQTKQDLKDAEALKSNPNHYSDLMEAQKAQYRKMKLSTKKLERC